MLSALDLFAVRYQVRPGPIRGRGAPLSGAERTALWRLRRAGEVPPYPRVAAELEANGIRTEDGCLEWMRSRNGKGYGKVRRGGRAYYVHRLALEARLGRPIAPGMLACHTCDNPPCFEPEHLYEGSAADNTADIYARGRRARADAA